MRERPIQVPALALALLIVLPLAACSPREPPPGPADAGGAEAASEPSEAPAAEPAAGEDLRAAARAVAEALRDRDFDALAERVGPDGVRFSPYSYVAPDEHVTLSADEVRALGEVLGETRVWGTQDGSGEPIDLPADAYFDRYVWDRPYLEEGSVAVDERQGSGSSLDNAADVYPDGRIVEWHVPGSNPDFGGMDWRSLRLVFAPGEGGGWTLVGVIHDEWTI